MSEIKDRVIQARKLLGFNQESFGKKIGMTKSAISKIEVGENSLTDKNIKLICKVFAINEKWLRTGEGEMRNDNEKGYISTVIGSLGDIDKKDMEIVELYLSLDEEYRIAFRTFLKGFTDKAKDE